MSGLPASARTAMSRANAIMGDLEPVIGLGAAQDMAAGVVQARCAGGAAFTISYGASIVENAAKNISAVRGGWER